MRALWCDRLTHFFKSAYRYAVLAAQTIIFVVKQPKASGMTSETVSLSGISHTLPQMLDLVQATHLRDDMVRLIGADELELDAAAVERMSTPCVQVLLAAGRAAQASKKTFKIINASEIFRTAIADLGLQSEFGKWMD